LLSVLGKIFERIVVNRIQDLYVGQHLDNGTQYGFKTGRSTDDALHRVTTLIKGCQTKYAVVIFFNIAGAFDNLWWPGILRRITKANCSSQLFDVMRQYFSHRRMIITSRYDKVEKQMTKGCPQGSILGPLARNWAMDDLLNELETLEHSNTYATAYADDLALLICENSRAAIETGTTRAVKIIQDWCAQYKLQIAIDKTKAILVKGTLHRERMPRIYVHDSKIEFKNEHKYLGIYIDRNLSFIPHVQHLRDKIIALSGILRKSIHEEWGLRRKAYMLLYKGLYVPAIVYGAVAWYERASHSHVDRILSSIQRRLLISMTRACRTASTAAMQVIAGCMPLKLEITKRALLTKVRWTKATNWATYLFDPNDDLPDGYLEKEKEKLEVILLNQWQEYWDDNQHGRKTYKFIQDVRFCCKNYKWFKPNKSAVDIITGYGSINETLFARNCADSPDCPRCTGTAESVEHILFHCPLYNELRYSFIIERRTEDTWTGLIDDEERFNLFCFYATEIFRRRREYILTTDSRDSPPPRG